ncbi:D-alanyl-D-alanine carboxypeptidase family protein [Catellatospora methionotrophica]|uniref:D-alanyl-D-alanine carboxypeptidase family protein n=1 Tax=Catellatospora methionotrophica TaxID=121620 RepID=UPI00140C6595|nr:D-alanyl-D-alanine carboxypeptidase family protein [Catellatospora methionotrophica]
MNRFAYTGQRLAVAVATAALAVSAAAAPATAHTGTAVSRAQDVAALPGISKRIMPCPKPAGPKVSAPTRPSPPAADPVQRTVGGDQLATAGLAVPTGATAPPGVSATSWLVADLDSGAVLGACGAHEYATPASVQKLLLAAAMIAKLDPERTVTITHADVDIEPGSSSAGLVEGGRYTIETLWLGLLLASGNDAANTLARLGGGTAADGVREMNAVAARLGAFQTHAVTPSGLDAPGQFTSAYDLALIMRACLAEPLFGKYALTRYTQMPDQGKHHKGFQIQNQNLLIDHYPGALGGKTGYTDLARHTYVGAAERDGRRLVVALLGAEYVPLRGWEQGAALLDWGFAQPADAAVGRLVDPGATAANPSAAAQAADTPGTGANALAGAGGTGTPSLLVFGAVIAAAGLLLSLAARRRRASHVARR